MLKVSKFSFLDVIKTRHHRPKLVSRAGSWNRRLNFSWLASPQKWRHTRVFRIFDRFNTQYQVKEAICGIDIHSPTLSEPLAPTHHCQTTFDSASHFLSISPGAFRSNFSRIFSLGDGLWFSSRLSRTKIKTWKSSFKPLRNKLIENCWVCLSGKK